MLTKELNVSAMISCTYSIQLLMHITQGGFTYVTEVLNYAGPGSYS